MQLGSGQPHFAIPAAAGAQPRSRSPLLVDTRLLSQAQALLPTSKAAAARDPLGHAVRRWVSPFCRLDESWESHQHPQCHTHPGQRAGLVGKSLL